MTNKLENLLRFEDFEKTWKSKDQKSTKHTEVGLDILNENLYMKVMDQNAAGWEESMKNFIKSIKKAFNENQIKDIKVNDNTVSFVIRGRKYKIDKEKGSITLWRMKATAFRKTYKDEAGRTKEERKRTKVREEVEVHIPFDKAEATKIYNALKERS